VIAWLQAEVTPTEACERLKVCPLKVVKSVKSENDLKCDLCLELVGEIELGVLDKRTEAQIERELERICRRFPLDVRRVCTSTVENHLTQIIAWINAGKTGKVICETLKFCVVKPALSENDLKCDVCSRLALRVDILLEEGHNEAHIRRELERDCHRLPRELRAGCEQLVANDLHQVIAWLQAEVTPTEVCERLKVCPLKTEVKKNDVFCDLCKQAVKYVEDLLKDGKVEHEIAVEVKKYVCEQLPFPISTACSGAVDQYLPEILKYLEQGLETLDICVRIGIC
jgi:saposin